MKINVYVSDRLYIQAPTLEARACHPLFTEVKLALTHLNPKYDTLKRLGKWVGGTPHHTIMWTHFDKDGLYYLGAPRGFEDKFLTMAFKHNIELEWVDKTVYPDLEEPIPNPTGALDDFQEDALSRLLAFSHGCMEAPTGAGKTNMMLSMLPYLQTPTLILVHTKELLMQTHRRIGEWLGIEAGILGGGKSKLRDVTVGMIQTLARIDLQKSGLATRFGAVIVDEAHHSPAMTWAEILNRMQARYRYGFTATAWRKDKLEFVVWDVIGTIRSKVTRKEVIEAGRIIWPDIEQIFTDYFFDMEDSAGQPDSSKWGAMVSDLTANVNRNRVIERNVRYHIIGDARGLILTDRIEHANVLTEMLEDLNPVLLTGALSTRRREAAMAQVRNGAALTIATIHLLGEGVDVPGWDILFLVSPLSRGPRVMQALGRIARVAPGKDSALLIDFVDNRVPMLLGASRARMALYRGKERKYESR